MMTNKTRLIILGLLLVIFKNSHALTTSTQEYASQQPSKLEAEMYEHNYHNPNTTLDYNYDDNEDPQSENLPPEEGMSYTVELSLIYHLMDGTLFDDGDETLVENRVQLSPLTGDTYGCNECEGYIKVSFFDDQQIKVGKGKVKEGAKCEFTDYEHPETYPAKPYYETHYSQANCIFSLNSPSPLAHISEVRLAGHNGLSALISSFSFSVRDENENVVFTQARSLSDKQFCLYGEETGIIPKSVSIDESTSSKNQGGLESFADSSLYKHQCNAEGYTYDQSRRITME